MYNIRKIMESYKDKVKENVKATYHCVDCLTKLKSTDHTTKCITCYYKCMIELDMKYS
jgi:hypothetical protein